MLRRLARTLPLLVGALVVVTTANADIAEETALAETYAPVVRLVEQEEDCGYGEPYTPIDVDLILGEPTVALRGPWGAGDVIGVGPTATDLAGGLYEYHLDFPGNALDPRCDYERWGDRVTAGSEPSVYAHVATDPRFPGKLALQYWFFYVFNDFNNKHEGDWEMVQIVFHARDAAEALTERPVEVGYSQHEGAERAAWGDDKLDRVGGTHPVVHPAAGSHANYFDAALYLGRTAEQGVGCDDTSSPTIDLRPAVRTIPSEGSAARSAFPWIAYEGRWGELQQAFYNGPTGPNLKRQWTEPIRWSEDWRDHSYAIPGGGVLGTGATDFFCSAVATGSDLLRRMVAAPGATVVVLAALIGLVLFALTRTTWSPSAPLRVQRRRTWGQILAAAGRMYWARWPLFVGIGLVFIPVTFVVAVLEAAAFDAAGGLGVDSDGETGGLLGLVAVTIGTTLTLAGLGLVQIATARALADIDAGREIDPLSAYRRTVGRYPALLGALAIAVVVVVALGLTVVLIPAAVWLAGRWALVAQAVELDGASTVGALRRSSELVRGRWFKVATLTIVSSGLALALGPLLGVLLIFVTSAPFVLVNIVAGLVYAVAMPFVTLTTAYVYFDAVVREQLEPQRGDDVLPAELTAGHPS
jgi:hypothetical protein